MAKYEYIFIAPLISFNYSGDSVIFSSNIQIRKISEEERKVFELYLEKWQNIKFEEFLIECRIIKKSIEDTPYQYLPEGRFEIEKLLTALRLYKEELIGYNFILQPLGTDPYAASATNLRHYELWYNPPSKDYIKEYILEKNEIDKLRDLYKKITNEFYQNFSISIEYFNKSYIEPYTPRDSFLDLMFALENIYLRGDQLELGYKLRMRAAIVLGDDFDSRKKIFEIMRKAYKIRGQIVHGEKSTKLTYDDLFELRNLTRRSILKFLVSNIDVKNLDELILKQ